MYTDDDVVRALLRAAGMAGTPLTVAGYDRVARDLSGPSSARIVQRFGSWNAACSAAGLPTNPGRGAPGRRWPREVVVSAVADYLATDGARGSYADYGRWAQETGGPSPQTVRNILGGWTAAKAAAQPSPRTGPKTSSHPGGDA